MRVTIQNRGGRLTEYAVEIIRNMTTPVDMANILFSDPTLDLYSLILNVFRDCGYKENILMGHNCIQIFFNMSFTENKNLFTIPLIENLVRLLETSPELRHNSLELLCTLSAHDENIILFSQFTNKLIQLIINILSRPKETKEIIRLTLVLLQHLSQIEYSRMPSICSSSTTPLLELLGSLIVNNTDDTRTLALNNVENFCQMDESMPAIECPLCLLQALVLVISKDVSNGKKALVILSNLSFTKENCKAMMSPSLGLVSEMIKVINDLKLSSRDKMDALVIISNMMRDDENLVILSTGGDLRLSLIKSLDQLASRRVLGRKIRGSDASPQMLLMTRIVSRLNTNFDPEVGNIISPIYSTDS